MPERRDNVVDVIFFNTHWIDHGQGESIFLLSPLYKSNVWHVAMKTQDAFLKVGILSQRENVLR